MLLIPFPCKLVEVWLSMCAQENNIRKLQTLLQISQSFWRLKRNSYNFSRTHFGIGFNVINSDVTDSALLNKDVVGQWLNGGKATTLRVNLGRGWAFGVGFMFLLIKNLSVWGVNRKYRTMRFIAGDREIILADLMESYVMSRDRSWAVFRSWSGGELFISSW